MTKKVFTVAMLTALFLTSCKATPKQENTETTSKETVEKTADEIIRGKETDKIGNVLEYAFNNTKGTTTLKLIGETIALVADSTMVSGANYKDDHYNYSQWHGKTTIEKDGKVIFETGEETQNETKKTNISFTLAKNYFVKNNVKKLDNPKIATAEKFNEIFGMATTMGKDSKPTEIDFSKQYVIAVILPETDLSTNINPISLLKNTENEITLNYKSVVGKKQSFTTLPNFAIIIDKKETGNVTLKEIK